MLAMPIDEKNRIIQDMNLRVQKTQQALEEWTHPWLLILDNYDNPSVFEKIWTYIPDTSYVTAIVTT